MYKLTTPTVTFNFPETIDMTQASDIKVTLKGSDRYKLTKESDDLDVTEHSVSVSFTQQETSRLALGNIEAQVNWLYTEGNIIKRACSNIVTLTVNKNLLEEVWE